MVREGALSLLFSDPSDRVAVQLQLLITNIARFDFPLRAEGLLSTLASAGSWESPLQPAGKLRALKALRSVLAGLSTRRFVFEQPRPGPGQTMVADLTQLTERMNAERESFKLRIHEVFEPLRTLFLRHCQAFTACAPGWEAHGVHAKAAIAALTELLCLSPNPEGLHPGTQALLEQMHATCSAVQQQSPVSGGPDGGAPQASPQAQAQLAAALPQPAARDAWLQLGGKLYERMCRAVIAYLDHYPLPFAEYVPFFLTLFVDNALIALDAATVRQMRSKRRVLLVRFIAKALLNPFYRSEWVDAPIPSGASPAQAASIRETKAKAAVASGALTRMLAADSPQCSQLVGAVIEKYVALTPEELEEWQADPEGYIRSMDVESSPDADTPRPIGVGLLLCMLERGGEPVAKALIALAAQLQQQVRVVRWQALPPVPAEPPRCLCPSIMFPCTQNA